MRRHNSLDYVCPHIDEDALQCPKPHSHYPDCFVCTKAIKQSVRGLTDALTEMEEQHEVQPVQRH